MSMMRDAEETTVRSGGEQPTARLGIPPERTSPLLEDSDAADRALSGETIAEYSDPMGTPAYTAPEQFRDRVSQHSDQYALECIAYELVTDQRPFAASDAFSLGLKHQAELPIPPTFYHSSLSNHSEHAILKAMAKQQRDRYADVATFISALLGFTMSEPERCLVKR